MRRQVEAFAAAALLCAGAGLAQTRAEPTAFTAPDGSRFVLVPDAAAPVVQWAVATPADTADEPPGLEGLAVAVARASLGGTWTTGSADPRRERTALEALDRAYAELMAAPQDAAVQQRLTDCDAAARQLGDPAAYRRVLATLPAHRLDVVVREGCSVLVLTTVAQAIGAVGARLVERREQQALRDFESAWRQEVMFRRGRYDAEPGAPVRAELLALAMPDHPASRAAERAGRGMPNRAQALAVFGATQHPSRSVHVLVGGLDPVAARTILEQTFAATALPAPAAATPPVRPIRSMRRSTVPGVRVPMVALAWVLPDAGDPFVLAAAARWLGGGPDSSVGRALGRQNRASATVACSAPWPAVVGGRSLLLVEVQDPSGGAGLGDLVLRACRDSTAAPPAAADLERGLAALQCHWTLANADPRWRAQDLARAAVLWPRLPPREAPPERIEATAIVDLLARTFAGQPVVVEGRP